MSIFTSISNMFSKKEIAEESLNAPTRLIDNYYVGMSFSEIASEPDIIANHDGRYLNKLMRRKYMYHGVEFSQGFAFDNNNTLSGVVLVREFSHDVFSLLYTSLIKDHILLHIDSKGTFYNFNLLYKDGSFLKQKLNKKFIFAITDDGLKTKDLKVGFVDKEIIDYVKTFNISCPRSEDIVVNMRQCHRLIDMIVDKTNVLLIKFVHPTYSSGRRKNM